MAGKGRVLFLFGVLILTGCIAELSNEQFREKYRAHLELSFQEFDQNESLGWRSVEKAEGELVAARLIENYIRKNKPKLYYQHLSMLNWHAGQLYALNGNTNKALSFFNQALIPDKKDWNAYVNGTIAFLKHEEEILNEYIRILSNGSGQNIQILQALQKGIGHQSYKEVYDQL